MRRVGRLVMAAGLATTVAGPPVIAGATDLAAQVVASGERRGPLVRNARPAPARPFTRLFQVAPLSPPATPRPAPRAFLSASPAPAAPGPRVVCGMVVIPADPGIDPKILTAPRGDARYPVRAMTPPRCR